MAAGGRMPTGFAALLQPRDPEHQRLAAQILACRADLRAAFGGADEAGSAGYWQWLGVHGVREFPELARFYPPVPPAELRATASCGATPELHLQSGAEDCRLVLELYELFAGRPAAGLRSVLDFGCGCGRLLHWLEIALPDTARAGADVRSASIEWCRRHLAGTFLANRPQPPLDLPAASQDLIVSLSVFSHLSAASNRAWIRELARVCRPDGLILLTTHGAFALAAALRSAEHRTLLGLSTGEAAACLRRLEQEHFLFHQAAPEIVRRAEGVEAEYGQTFFDAAFVREQWREHVRLLGCIPVAHVFLQDVYVLQPRARPERPA